MATYAIHDGQTVVNVIIADDVETAEAATGMSALEVDEDGAPGIGWTLEGGEWVAPPPPEPVPAEDEPAVEHVEEPAPEPEA